VATNSIDGALLSAGKTEIETFTGRFVDVLHPNPDTISFDDIAHALAMTCRYGGHIKKFYSVAEHCVLVTRLVKWMLEHDDTPHSADYKRVQMANALLHDAAEAYLGDVVAPLKYALREGAIPHDKNVGYDSLTERMEDALFQALNAPRLKVSPLIQICDLWALKIEATHLTRTGGAHWRWPGELPCDGYPPEGVDFRELGQEPLAARQEFVNAWEALRY
jgi:hypothetical protein